MKNMHPFSYVTIQYDCEDCEFLTKEKLIALQSAHDLMAETRSKAAACLWSARRKARAFRDKVIEQSSQQVEDMFSVVKQRASTDALKWLVDEQNWAEDLYQTILSQQTEFLIGKLNAVADDLPWGDIISGVIEDTIADVKESDMLILSVPEKDFEQLHDTFNTTGVRVISDASIKNGQALIENKVMRIELDMRTQLDEIILQLRNLGVQKV